MQNKKVLFFELSKSKRIIWKVLLFFAFIHLTHSSFSQKIDSTKSISYFSGAASVTNNGISIVPSFASFQYGQD